MDAHGRTQMQAQVKRHRWEKSLRFFRGGVAKVIGPGVLTGASDDDPSGIATYSDAGARFGLPFLWTTLFSIPFMIAIQEVCARLGRVTGKGLAGNIRQHFSPWVLYPVVLLLAIANIVNLAADLRAMGEALRLIVGGSALAYAAGFAAVSLLLQVCIPYRRYSYGLRVMALALLAYVATGLLGHVGWEAVLYHTLVPRMEWSGRFLAMFIAVVGTTITPYLFFWQASLETEEIRRTPAEAPLKKEPGQAREQLARIRWDTYTGMILSNVIAFFIMLTTAVAINMNPAAPIKDLQTAQQAAEALRPATGALAFYLFAAGIIGTGMLAVPTLTGSLAYAVGEAMRWPVGLERKPGKARGFYGVAAAGMALGLALNFLPGFDPIRALVWAAVVNGIVAVPLMVVVTLMAYNPQIMGKFSLVSPVLRAMSWAATAIMAAASVGLACTWGK